MPPLSLPKLSGDFLLKQLHLGARANHVSIDFWPFVPRYVMQWLQLIFELANVCLAFVRPPLPKQLSLVYFWSKL